MAAQPRRAALARTPLSRANFLQHRGNAQQGRRRRGVVPAPGRRTNSPPRATTRYVASRALPSETRAVNIPSPPRMWSSKPSRATASGNASNVRRSVFTTLRILQAWGDQLDFSILNPQFPFPIYPSQCPGGGSETQNSKLRNGNYSVWADGKSEIRNPKSEIRNRRGRVDGNSEFRIPIPEFGRVNGRHS